MPKLVRIAAGVAVVALLAYVYVWRPRTMNEELYAAMALLGLVGGLLMGSWWSLALAPAAIIVSWWLWRRVECIGCPSGQEQLALLGMVMLATFLSGLAALGAAAGTLGAKLVSRARHPSCSASR